MSRDAGRLADTTLCGMCLERFTGKTPQDAADACRQHQEAGCPKETVAAPAERVLGPANAS
jgi:hypothetical protein